MFIDDIKSSYAENNLGRTLENLVLHRRPRKIIEFGVYHGYSTVHMANGLKRLGRGHLIACDLWDKYEFNHTTMDVAQKNVDRYMLTDYVTLWQANFHEWLSNPTPFDMLHVDISNNGDLIEEMLTKLAPQIKTGSIVVFEGGSDERDRIEWMLKFKKRPINPLQEKLGFKILDERFPSISIATK